MSMSDTAQPNKHAAEHALQPTALLVRFSALQCRQCLPA
jgi:hypothetical protein